MSDISISVIVCTRNRAQWLRACLHSFEHINTGIAWELIVVDNGSSDQTQAVIHQCAAATSIELVCGYEPREGVSFARNKGIELARGPFIAFTDDDCYPRQDYIDSLFARLSGDSELGFVGGRVLLFDPEDYPVTIQTHNALVQLNPGEFLYAGFIHGANFAFRQSALVQARGFDVRLGTGTRFPSEDVDILAELLRLGWRGQYDPAIVVYHHHRRRSQAQIDHLVLGYDWGRGAYFAKHILRPVHRLLFLRQWARNIRWQPARTSRREIQAALVFWWCLLTK